MNAATYRIGIDVGGTFTDLILARSDGTSALAKAFTTPSDPSLGAMQGLRDLAAQQGLSLPSLLSKTELVIHGTTTADNTMIEMTGPVTGLLTTAGHRDEIELRRGFKESIWDPALPPPAPIAPRRRRLGIPERLDAQGSVVLPLDEDAARASVRRLKKMGVESAAVVFLFSFLNPCHERRLREIIAEEYPELGHVSLSHEVMPSTAEFERTSTTLVNAYVAPRLVDYLRRFQAELREAGFQRDVLVMQSNGGVTTVDSVAGKAVTTLGSGPAGGVMGACDLGSRIGVKQFIAFDMGGTSSDVCLIRDGAPTIKSFWNWHHRYLIGLPMVDFHSIGAGGGSIASVDGGILKVGPRSAAADPGPICYGRGGKEPTVTDANLVLGYLNPRELCGGALALETSQVRETIAGKIGAPLRLDVAQAAAAIIRIVNANMVNAIRRISCQSGYDPREFSLIAFGGNGPLHAGALARELAIERIVVPRAAPAFSALGLVGADRLVDLVRSYITVAADADLERINGLFEEMAAGAATEVGSSGADVARMVFQRSLGICYVGQSIDLIVPVPEGRRPLRPVDLKNAISRFHDLYASLHGYAQRDEEPLLRSVRLRVIGKTEGPELRAPARPGRSFSALRGHRDAFFDGRFVPTPVYDGRSLGSGSNLSGPAIVEEPFTTLLVHPGQRARLDALGNYVLTFE